jgi:fructose-1,6-bisphosphatase
VKRKANSDVSEQPSKIIRSELQKVEENHLTENDLKSLSMAIYRERRKRHPTLPKSREDMHRWNDNRNV